MRSEGYGSLLVCVSVTTLARESLGSMLRKRYAENVFLVDFGKNFRSKVMG